MPKIIAETAWHHEGDYTFMQQLVSAILRDSKADIVKLHITLNFDEYMHKSHDSYNLLSRWLFNENQWSELVKAIKLSNKELMLLVNDSEAIDFASKVNPNYIELHSSCLNVPHLQNAVNSKFKSDVKIVLGVGGSTLDEIENAVNIFSNRETILMFGFQNYPTSYSDVNLKKILKIQSMYNKCLFGYADHTAWNSDDNELISLLVAANNMDYVEKHVTYKYGEERTDFSAAVSIDMFNSLSKKLEKLESLKGNGSTDLNDAEKNYSIYGPNKMAGIAKKNIGKGQVLMSEDIYFSRINKKTSMSQVDLKNKIGEKLKKNIAENDVFDHQHFKQE